MREIYLDYNKQLRMSRRYPSNRISNQKYSIINFIPVVLFNQFKFFFNLFFLLICLSQFIEALRVGFLFTYLSPLVFVLLLTMAKEAHDDWLRYQRDKVLNEKQYQKLDLLTGRAVPVKAQSLKVGDIIYINSNERAPADVVLLLTTDKSGTVFIRTD